MLDRNGINMSLTEQEIRDKVTSIIQKMFEVSNEIAYELATVDCDKWNTCSVCIKARKLVKLIKEFWEIQKLIPHVEVSKPSEKLIEKPATTSKQ